MREQKVVIGVVMDGQGRFLVSFNPKWGGYAFRMIAVPEGGEILDSLAVQAAEHDLGCRLPNATATELDYMGHFGVSKRTGEETLYEYWLYIVEPNQGLDLLAAPTTMASVRTTVLSQIPSRKLGEPLRRSERGIALIKRAPVGKRQWLAQWNENWKAFFFVGGHRRNGEAFHDCVVREIEEEVGLSAQICLVAANPARHRGYRATSRSANELTPYTMEVFDAAPTLEGFETISRNLASKWLDETETAAWRTTTAER